MRGRWELLTAVVRGRRVRRSVQEQIQLSTSALLYPDRPGPGPNWPRTELTPDPDRPRTFAILGMLKKAASGVLALLPCSRTGRTLRARHWARSPRRGKQKLRPCWTDSPPPRGHAF